jgi:hypothetical protein
MDLNDLYFRHQISVMRAKAASDEAMRGTHQRYADELAHRISRWQQRAGAGAASMWNVCRAAACRDVPVGVLS